MFEGLSEKAWVGCGRLLLGVPLKVPVDDIVMLQPLPEHPVQVCADNCTGGGGCCCRAERRVAARLSRASQSKQTKLAAAGIRAVQLLLRAPAGAPETPACATPPVSHCQGPTRSNSTAPSPRITSTHNLAVDTLPPPPPTPSVPPSASRHALAESAHHTRPAWSRSARTSTTPTDRLRDTHM